MFGNRAVQVSVVKKAPASDTTDINNVVPSVDPNQINNLLKDYTTHVAVTVGTVIVGNRLLKTACDIAIIAAKAKLK